MTKTVLLFGIFGAWFLYDRYKFIQETRRKVAELETAFQDAIKQNEIMDDAKWEGILLNACSKDLETLEKEFKGLIPLDRFNHELTSAARELFKHFKNRKPVREDVARILNLLQLFTMTAAHNNEINSKQLN